jgi:phosphate transport system substrate-binding protein
MLVMTLRPLAAMALLLACAAAGGCGRTTKQGLTLAGSTSVQPFAEKWAEAYRARHPKVNIEVQGGGSTAGVQAALTGAAEIGMSSRPLTGEEVSRMAAVPVARDAIAIVVHPRSPVGDLTLEQVRAIYAGEIRSWRTVGGADRTIDVITREEGSGTRGAFEALVMGGRRIGSFALVQDSAGAVRQMVASDPAAVGYLSLGLVDDSVKSLRLAGVLPSEANIDAGRYSLVRPFLFVVLPGATTGPARDFIDWVTGPEGRALTRREGLLPPGG